MNNLEWLYEHDMRFSAIVDSYVGWTVDDLGESTTWDWLMADIGADGSFYEASNRPIGKSDAPKSWETAENATSKGEICDLDDSREKLEADVYNHIAISITPNKEDDGVLAPYTTVLEWLDRQAVITADANKELIEWQAATVARLQKEVDTIKAANDDYRDEVDRLQRRNDELRTSYDKLKRERDNLADDLLACNQEREQLRKHLGIALDHAHDICSLVDIDGNVLDVGD